MRITLGKVGRLLAGASLLATITYAMTRPYAAYAHGGDSTPTVAADDDDVYTPWPDDDGDEHDGTPWPDDEDDDDDDGTSWPDDDDDDGDDDDDDDGGHSTPRPTKTPRPTRTPRPTHTPRPEDTPCPSPTPRYSPTPVPQDTDVPAPTDTPTYVPSATETLAPSPTATVYVSSTPEDTDIPSATATVYLSPTPTVSLTDTPEDEPTDSPTALPTYIPTTAVPTDGPTTIPPTQVSTETPDDGPSPGSSPTYVPQDTPVVLLLAQPSGGDITPDDSLEGRMDAGKALIGLGALLAVGSAAYLVARKKSPQSPEDAIPPDAPSPTSYTGVLAQLSQAENGAVRDLAAILSGKKPGLWRWEHRVKALEESLGRESLWPYQAGQVSEALERNSYLRRTHPDHYQAAKALLGADDAAR